MKRFSLALGALLAVIAILGWLLVPSLAQRQALRVQRLDEMGMRRNLPGGFTVVLGPISSERCAPLGFRADVRYSLVARSDKEGYRPTVRNHYTFPHSAYRGEIWVWAARFSEAFGQIAPQRRHALLEFLSRNDDLLLWNVVPLEDIEQPYSEAQRAFDAATRWQTERGVASGLIILTNVEVSDGGRHWWVLAWNQSESRWDAVFKD